MAGNNVNTKLPTQYYIYFKYSDKILRSLLKKEFNLDLTSEERKVFFRDVWQDRGPFLRETKEYPTKVFRVASSETTIEIIEDDRSLFYLNSDDDVLLEKISNRFLSYDVKLRYRNKKKECVVLQDFKSVFQVMNFGYTWSLEMRNSEEYLFGYSQKNPEFIELKKIDDHSALLSFQFTGKISDKLSQFYEKYRQISHNMEHSVPSLKKEATENIDSLLSNVIGYSSVMREFHELILKQGMVEWFGRYF